MSFLGFFWVKLVTKNIVLGSQGPQWCFFRFSSCRDTLIHLVVPKKKKYFSGEPVLYFERFTDFEIFFDFKWLFTKYFLQNILSSRQNFEHYRFTFFSFFKDRFCNGMVKQRNFPHVVDLSFDARFVKYYPFSSHFHKQCPINKIQVKCLQFGQNLPDTFWTYSLQIVSDKLRELLISSFQSCDSDFWKPRQISQIMEID